MMKKLVYITSGLICLTAAAYADQIRPVQISKNVYMIRMQNEHAFVAKLNAFNIARYHCSKINHQTYKVLNQESHYHGQSGTAIATGALVSTFMGLSRNISRNNSDNEFILKFSCIPFSRA